MNKQKNKHQFVNKPSIDAIADQWANLVLSHIRAKRLGNKKFISINKKYEYATK